MFLYFFPNLKTKPSSDSCLTIANNEAVWEKMLRFWDEIIKLQQLCGCTETGGVGLPLFSAVVSYNIYKLHLVLQIVPNVSPFLYFGRKKPVLPV